MHNALIHELSNGWARHVCQRKRSSKERRFRRRHGEIPWSVGLGMHVLRRAEREGASKSLLVRSRCNWFMSGGLLERDRTKRGTIMVKKGAEKPNSVKNSFRRRQTSTCLTRIGSVSLFDLKVPRKRKGHFADKMLYSPDGKLVGRRVGKSKQMSDSRRTMPKRLSRPSSSISMLPRAPSQRFRRRARSFVNSVFIRGAGHKVPYMLKKVPDWECLVMINFKRLGHQGVLKWWSEKFPPEPQKKLPRGCCFCLRRRLDVTRGCTNCIVVQMGYGQCEGKCAECCYGACGNRISTREYASRLQLGDFSQSPKFGETCGACGRCPIGNFFSR